MGKTKDFKAIILVNDYLIPFLNKITKENDGRIVFRNLPLTERD